MQAATLTRVIFNPEAGGIRRGGKRMLEDAIAQLAAQGIPASLQATSGPNTAGAIARDLVRNEGVSRVLVAGGDGTLNEVLNGIVGLDVELGVLPAGTANVLANELGIGRWSRALRAISACRPCRIPVGRLDFPDGSSRYFLMMAGAGLDARMVHQVDPGLKRRVGKLAYWVAGLSQLGRKLEQLHVRVDGRQMQGSFCLASRVRNYGGDLEIAPTIRLTDDDLEVVLFQATLTATYLAHLANVVAGRVQSAQGINTMRARSIEVLPAGTEPVHLQVDGEHAGYLPVRISVCPDALTLLTPPSYKGQLAAKAA